MKKTRRGDSYWVLTDVPTVHVDEKKVAKGLRHYDLLKRKGKI